MNDDSDGFGILMGCGCIVIFFFILMWIVGFFAGWSVLTI